MTTTEKLRARMCAWMKRRATSVALKPLAQEESRILLDAMAAGGRYSIIDLELRDMVQAASVLLDLQRRGLVRADIRFNQGVSDQPDLIHVELTDEGRKAVEATDEVRLR